MVAEVAEYSVSIAERFVDDLGDHDLVRAGGRHDASRHDHRHTAHLFSTQLAFT
jgi:hypothetical protein